MDEEEAPKLALTVIRLGTPLKFVLRSTTFLPILRNPTSRTIDTYTDNFDNIARENIEGKPPNVGITTFIAHQQQDLLDLFQQQSSPITSNIQHFLSRMNKSTSILLTPSNLVRYASWIFDTWAIDHVCHSQEVFHTLLTIPHITVKLLNGSTIITGTAGIIRLNRTCT